MQKMAIVILLLSFGSLLFAQDPDEMVDARPLNTLNISVLGDASMVSFGYEKLFLVQPPFIVSSKLGIGYNEEFQLCFFGPCTSPPKMFFTIPHHVTCNYGKGRHFFEFGIGGTIVIGKTNQPYLLYPTLGYRYLPFSSGKFNFRVYSQVPVTGLDTGEVLFLPFGFSFGASF